MTSTPGWHADPYGVESLRYFRLDQQQVVADRKESRYDGTDWTSHTAPQAPTKPDEKTPDAHGHPVRAAHYGAFELERASTADLRQASTRASAGMCLDGCGRR